jgi:hypothetical protein
VSAYCHFSLSDYFRALKTTLDGGASGAEGIIYAPVRRFDETALVLPSDRFLIGQLMVMADRIFIEDSDLTAGRLRRFGRELAAGHIIYSVAKITRPKQGSLPPVMERMKRVYQYVSAGQPLVFRGSSWRLPENVVRSLVLRPLLELCRRYSMPAKPCKTNLITTL